MSAHQQLADNRLVQVQRYLMEFMGCISSRPDVLSKYISLQKPAQTMVDSILIKIFKTEPYMEYFKNRDIVKIQESLDLEVENVTKTYGNNVGNFFAQIVKDVFKNETPASIEKLCICGHSLCILCTWQM